MMDTFEGNGSSVNMMMTCWGEMPSLRVDLLDLPLFPLHPLLTVDDMSVERFGAPELLLEDVLLLQQPLELFLL